MSTIDSSTSVKPELGEVESAIDNHRVNNTVA